MLVLNTKKDTNGSLSKFKTQTDFCSCPLDCALRNEECAKRQKEMHFFNETTMKEIMQILYSGVNNKM